MHSPSVLHIETLIIAPLNILDIQWAPHLQQGLGVLVVLYLPLFLEDLLGLLDLGHPVKIRSEHVSLRGFIAAITMTDTCVSVNAHQGQRQLCLSSMATHMCRMLCESANIKYMTLYIIGVWHTEATYVHVHLYIC